jgi:hypothetical protein
MKKFNKRDIFKTPEGYFDELPDIIVSRYEKGKIKQISVFKKYAVAAVLLLGFGIYFLNQNTDHYIAAGTDVHQEIDMFINSDYWQVEDILMLADNPNSILDEIIMTEWSEYDGEADEFENNIWY